MNEMTTELPFRIALGVVMFLTMAVTLYHRIRAASSGEKISHKGHLEFLKNCHGVNFILTKP